MAQNEVGIEVSYLKRINLGNYQHKEYAVKLNGTESQIHDQFAERKARVQNLLEQIEQMVDEANEANILRAKLAETAALEAAREAEFKAQNKTRIDGVK